MSSHTLRKYFSMLTNDKKFVSKDIKSIDAKEYLDYINTI